MDKEKEMSGSLNCIEVKGMNNHNQHYLKRFFSRAGTVEDVRKLEDRVIVVNFTLFRNLSTSPVFTESSSLIGETMKNTQLKFASWTPSTLLKWYHAKKNMQITQQPSHSPPKKKLPNLITTNTRKKYNLGLSMFPTTGPKLWKSSM